MTGDDNVDVCEHLPAGPRLLIIDGNNVVRRIYEARKDAPPDERLEGAIRATLASFRRALREINPTHAVVVFDFGGETWRHERCPGYSKNRSPMAEELRDAMAGLRQTVTSELGLHCLSIPGLEADDVIATVALRWSIPSRGACVVLSTDKDMLQLLAQGVHIRDHFARVWLDDAHVMSKFGVTPAQIGDYLALRGDKTDGVPGVPGIGPTIAADLLKRFGSLDECLTQARIIPGQPGRRLREGREQARMSRLLVSFKTDVPLGISWASLRLGN